MQLLFLLFGALSFFQLSSDSTISDTLYVFDAVDSTYSHMVFELTYDTNQPILATDFFIPPGRMEKSLPTDSEIPPDESLFFSDFESIEEGEQELFPLSAVVKPFTVKNDTAVSKCSGIMVSKKHMLTAAHCTYINDQLNPELYAYTGYHKNGINEVYRLTRAIKYYSTINYENDESFYDNDIALLELETEIGEQSGWIGFGFLNNVEHAFYENHIAYTYGYPGDTSLVDSSIVYDGEEMIAGYGFARKSSRRSNKIQIKTVGIPGQSGSSLFVEHEEYGYFSMGVAHSTSLGSKTFDFQALNAFTYLAFAEITDETTTTNTNEKEIAGAFKLHQNYPNPFNPTTTIPFELSRAQTINLVVYDATGKEVATLISDERKISGYHSVTFNAPGLSSGIYLYVLQGEQFRQAKKLLLIK